MKCNGKLLVVQHSYLACGAQLLQCGAGEGASCEFGVHERYTGSPDKSEAAGDLEREADRGACRTEQKKGRTRTHSKKA